MLGILVYYIKWEGECIDFFGNLGKCNLGTGNKSTEQIAQDTFLDEHPEKQTSRLPKLMTDSSLVR